ncbi:aminoglycoside phosphotransferase family protein [Rickettsiales endosymbiont of Stachyamoeba lipophora]|uniref:aminoglycoside phosphotransferase family protein n=1 Tax=Rickettsiales endosymbiont of Stachyamoeba lipophora TaxID=2486578 RepID=UPI000F64E7C3|nr:aminoglycoside phosphotransferase family protein [Rickettsiales endosymbiont of Stachyamoeba lipophora]AZL16126.1 hypothetical protein EF513_06230 [Rickettsiales endosymbiont of Stachyamoeba lipophora]
MWKEQERKWLDNIPLIVQQLVESWNLSNLNVLSDLTYNYILSGYQNSLPIILKLSGDKQALSLEAEMLELYQGNIFVRLISKNLEMGALLIERVIPGTTLSELFPDRDTQAVGHASSIIKQINNYPRHYSQLNLSKYPTVATWLKVLDHEYNIPTEYLTKAQMLKANNC